MKNPTCGLSYILTYIRYLQNMKINKIKSSNPKTPFYYFDLVDYTKKNQNTTITKEKPQKNLSKYFKPQIKGTYYLLQNNVENNFLLSILQNYGQIPPVLTTYHTTLIYITRSYILPYKQSNIPIIAGTTKQIYYQAVKQTK